MVPNLVSIVTAGLSVIASFAAAFAAWLSLGISREARNERLTEKNKSNPVVHVLDVDGRRFTLLIRNEGPGPANDIHIALSPAFEPKGQATAQVCHVSDSQPAKQPIPIGGPMPPGDSQIFAAHWDDDPPGRIQLSIVWIDGNGDRKGRNTIIESGLKAPN